VTIHAAEPGQEFRDIRCSHSESLPALLTQLRLSVLISTYQTGHLVVVAARQGRLVLSFHQFQRAMGIAVSRCGPCRRMEAGNGTKRGMHAIGRSRQKKASKARIATSFVRL